MRHFGRYKVQNSHWPYNSKIVSMNKAEAFSSSKDWKMRIITGMGLYKLFNPSKEVSNIIMSISISTWKEAIKVNTTRPFSLPPLFLWQSWIHHVPDELDILSVLHQRTNQRQSWASHSFFSIKRKCTKYPRLLQSQKMLYGY